jgi:hypothetical protein
MVSSFLFSLSFNLKWFLAIAEKGQSVASQTGDMMRISKPDSSEVASLDLITLEMNAG